MTRTLTAVSFASLLLLAACGGGEPGAGPTLGSGGSGGSSGGGGTSECGSTPSLDCYLGAYFQAYCENSAKCCQEVEKPYSVPECVDNLQWAYSIKSYVAEGTVKYDPTKIGACLSDMHSLANACDLESRKGACNDVFVGTLPPGAPCDIEAQCEKPSDAFGVSCLGECHIFKHGKQGDPCPAEPADYVNHTCDEADGLFCDKDTETCQPFRKLGEACDPFHDCVATAYCDFGVCTEKVAKGGDCYEYDACQKGLYCTEEWQCVDAKPDGATCTSWDQCLAENCIYDGAGGGVCGAQPVTDPHYFCQ